jgi:hypothetical protein
MPSTKGAKMYLYNAKASANFMRFGFDVWALYFDALTVVVLRSLKIAAGGPAADREAQLMVAEKMESAAELGMAASSGALGLSPQATTGKVVRHYGRKVRANKRRLSRLP